MWTVEVVNVKYLHLIPATLLRFTVKKNETSKTTQIIKLQMFAPFYYNFLSPHMGGGATILQGGQKKIYFAPPPGKNL